MDDTLCDAFARRLSGRLFHRCTRRGAVGFGLTMPFLIGDDAEARKKRKRKRKKRRQSAPSACARACGSACSFCFHRAAGSLLCGDGAGGSCDASAACASDDECSPGPPTHFCLVSSEDPATGAITPTCLTPGGHCAQVTVCAA